MIMLINHIPSHNHLRKGRRNNLVSYWMLNISSECAQGVLCLLLQIPVFLSSVNPFISYIYKYKEIKHKGRLTVWACNK